MKNISITERIISNQRIVVQKAIVPEQFELERAHNVGLHPNHGQDHSSLRYRSDRDDRQYQEMYRVLSVIQQSDGIQSNLYKPIH
jgi:hypothetical protein